MPSLLHTEYVSARQTENRFLLTLRFEPRSSGATQEQIETVALASKQPKLAQSGPDVLNEIHHRRRCWVGSPYLGICVYSLQVCEVSFRICAVDPIFHIERNDSHFHPHNCSGPWGHLYLFLSLIGYHPLNPSLCIDSRLSPFTARHYAETPNRKRHFRIVAFYNDRFREILRGHDIVSHTDAPQSLILFTIWPTMACETVNTLVEIGAPMERASPTL